MRTYVLSVFDKLENLPHVVRISSETDDLRQIILAAYSQLVGSEEPLTEEYVDANEALFVDFVIVSVFADPGDNLLPDIQLEDL